MLKKISLALFVILPIIFFALLLNTPASASPSNAPKVAITEYPLNPGYINPGAIIRGPDNNVWFTEVISSTNGYAIARISPNGVITDFPIPGTPCSLVSGPDGNIWYTRSDANAIGRMTTAGVVNTYALATGACGGITSGNDGNLWVNTGSNILKITTAGTLADQIPIPVDFSCAGIVWGQDNNIWCGSNTKIVRMTPIGTFTGFPIPQSPISFSGLTLGSDGNIWYIDGYGTQYGRTNPSGTIATFPVLSYNLNFFFGGMITGPDNNFWATMAYCSGYCADIVRLTLNGLVTRVTCIGCRFIRLVSGSDGNIWFTVTMNDGNTYKIGVLDPSSVPLYLSYFPFVGK